MNLHLHHDQLRKLAGKLAKARRREIGGVLVGEHVGTDVFRVVDLSFQRTAGTELCFVRKPEQHERFVADFFQRTGMQFQRFNYLGEWHSHPSFPASPSAVDRDQMQAIVEAGPDAPLFAVLLVVRLSARDEIELSATAFRARCAPSAVTIHLSPRLKDDPVPTETSWWQRVLKRRGQDIRIHSIPIDYNSAGSPESGGRQRPWRNPMKARFEGEEGHGRLKQALRDQKILGCDTNLIEDVAGALVLSDAKAGDVIIEQGSPGGDLHFIIMGAGVEILIDNRPVAAREPGHVVGEMSAIEPAGLRSATARVVGDTVIGKLDGEIFQKLAEQHPQTIYRGIARVVSDRLRERSKFIRPRGARPQVFVGSSVEALQVAEAICLAFDHFPADICLWSDAGSVFKPSSTPIEDLAASLERFDFAVFAVTPDDLLKLRRSTGASEEFEAARDNVWLEFGLFAGALGRERVFGIAPRGAKMRRPTDLIGVTLLEYEPVSAGTRPNVAVACTQMKDRISALKAR